MRAAIFAVGIFISTGAIAAPFDCIKVDNDLDRLACYDREAGRTPKAERVATPAGKWSIQKESSKMTDQTTVILSLPSEEIVDCGWNRGGKIRLVLRCLENATAMFFETGCHMTSGSYNDYGDITYRLDDDKARTVAGLDSTDHRALGLWNGGRSIPVIKQMVGKSKIVVRMTPYGESPFTATFNIAGLDASIAPLKEACGW